MTKSKSDLKCSIEILNQSKKTKNKKSILSFDIELPNPTIQDTFLSNFKDFEFSEGEKKILSRKDRNKIYCFDHLEHDEILQASEKLIKKLSKMTEDELLIKGNEIGGYVCLTALSSGELPKRENWIFELYSVPVSLFPKDLCKETDIKNEHNLSLCLDDNSWLAPLTTLHDFPSYLEEPNQRKRKKAA